MYLSSKGKLDLVFTFYRGIYIFPFVRLPSPNFISTLVPNLLISEESKMVDLEMELGLTIPCSPQ